MVRLWYDGSLDDVRIYSTALDASQVSALQWDNRPCDIGAPGDGVDGGILVRFDLLDPL